MKKKTNPAPRKSVDGALRFWRYGAFGTLGLQYFYAGRPGAGIGQCLMGIFLWTLFIVSFFEPANLTSKLLFAVFLLTLLTFISARNYVKIKRGQFTDREGHIIC